MGSIVELEGNFDLNEINVAIVQAQIKIVDELQASMAVVYEYSRKSNYVFPKITTKIINDVNLGFK